MAAVPDADLAGPLFEQYERGLYRFCLSRLRSREDAEDAVQATFLRAVRALERGVRPDVAPAWLFTIARNVCSSRRLAALRRARVETPRDLDHLHPSALAREDDRPNELIGLGDALAEMPPQLRRVVLLREWRGLSYGEIGDELGVSQAAVETLLFRARRDLAKRLRGLLDFGPLLGLKAVLGGATVAAVAVATVHPPRVALPAHVGHSPARVAPAAVVVPHPTTLLVVRRVAPVARPALVVHVRHVSLRSAVRAVPPPVAPPRPVTVRAHASTPAEPTRLPRTAVAPPPPASAPAPAPTPTPAPVSAPDPEPAASVAAPRSTPPAPVTPPAPAAPAVSVPAPVASAVQQTSDELQQTATTVVSTVTSAAPPVPTDVPVPNPTGILGGG